MKENDCALQSPSLRFCPHRFGSHSTQHGASSPVHIRRKHLVPIAVAGAILLVTSWSGSTGHSDPASSTLKKGSASLKKTEELHRRDASRGAGGAGEAADDLAVLEPEPPEPTAEALAPERSRDAPYGDFCETRPRGEKQVWNWSKKVISYSLFLPDDLKGQEVPEYLLGGLLANIRLAEVYYPEWVVRVYVLNLDDAQIDQVLGLDDRRLEVVKCYDDSPLNLGSTARKMYTRFLAVDDPTVEFGMIRDLDSRPSIRELLAVNEWIASGLGFHTLRDHRYHIIPIMGCSFGARKGTIAMTEVMRRALKDHPKEVPGCCADDQNFLSSYVWGAVHENAIDHDMDAGRCHRMGAKVCRQWPIGPRDDEEFYVGQPFKAGHGGDTHYECSLQCKMSNEAWYKSALESNH